MNARLLTLIAAHGSRPGPAVTLQLVMQRDAINIETLGRSALVSATLVEHAKNVRPLDFVKSLARSCGWRCLLEDEVVFVKLRLLRSHHRPLDRILKFPGVSRPLLLLQLRHCPWRNARNVLVHR